VTALPLILEPEQLADKQSSSLLLIDLCGARYLQQHLPGACALDFSWILRTDPPRMGLLPDAGQLGRLFSAFGLTPDTHVVAYDDEGGGRASRLLWTLEVLGHNRYSLLNGGLPAWLHAGLPVESTVNWPTPTHYQASLHDGPVADRDYLLQHLNDEDLVILDARSPAEYRGENRLAERGGHIPGAINLEWTEAMDRQRDNRLQPSPALQAMLAEKGITEDKQVVVYCQTHHRSALSFIMLKSLGFTRIKGYPGSWSEWGNDPSTPIAVE
jgi:thiosulfate/3-mercaptopyruvate sulfurtransferase